MWTPPERSPEALAIYAAAETDKHTHPERYVLDADALAAAAFAKAPLPAGDDGDWQPGFSAWVAAAREEGQLNALGERGMAGTAIGRLQARGAIARAFEHTPELRRRVIDRPLFIIGGWRTGTTLLQRLLAAVPGLRAAYPAELSVPWRFAGVDHAAREVLLDAGDAAHQRLHLLNPAMQAIHPSGGRLPEECVLAMGTDLRNWGFTSTLRCPSYAAWLASADLGPGYRRYADILRLLEDGSARRWVLKAPAHTAELPSLFAAFPDARVVHLHRDVVDTVTSGASLFAVFRSTYSDRVDPEEVGQYQFDATATWFERAMVARDALPRNAFIDVAYPELVADPIALARRICTACEIEWTDSTGPLLEARLAALETLHGAHRYRPEDFGLEPDQIRARFARYRSRFGLP
jgi:hypothetical protein